MSDATMATLGRRLAQALSHFARERDETSKKQIAELHTELCVAYRKEIDQDQTTKESGNIE